MLKLDDCKRPRDHWTGPSNGEGIGINQNIAIGGEERGWGNREKHYYNTDRSADVDALWRSAPPGLSIVVLNDVDGIDGETVGISSAPCIASHINVTSTSPVTTGRRKPIYGTDGHFQE